MNDPARSRFMPDLEAMRVHLPDLGQSLATAAAELARDLTAERCDLMLDRLQVASNTVRAIRRALAEGNQK